MFLLGVVVDCFRDGVGSRLMGIRLALSFMVLLLCAGHFWTFTQNLLHECSGVFGVMDGDTMNGRH